MSKLTQIEKRLVAVSLGIEKLPKEFQENIISRLEDLILSRLTAKLGESLSEDDIKKIESSEGCDVAGTYFKNIDEVVKDVSLSTISEFRKIAATVGSGK